MKIIVVDDDEEDRMLAKEALELVGITKEVTFFNSGQELLDFLFAGEDDKESKKSLPDLILLDLNMPKKDGRQCLKEIKTHKDYAMIPIVILTTSTSGSDIIKSYSLGANSFITKPTDFNRFVEIMSCLKLYWDNIVQLPKGNS